MRFLTAYVPLVLGLFGLIAGGPWMWAGLVLTYLFVVLGDALMGDDLSPPRKEPSLALDLMLYMALPLMLVLLFVFAWSFAPGDPLGFGAAVLTLAGFDALAAKAATHPAHLTGATLSTGLVIAYIATNIGHELIHRTWHSISMTTGRWLLAMSWDAQFAIEHVYGHHAHVATDRDPATAKRGQSVYSFLVTSTLGQMKSAWAIETGRLNRIGAHRWGWRNRVLRGHGMSLALALFCGLIGGPLAALAFVAAAFYAKSYLEIVNYLEHYGLVRVPGQPVEPRHSWNSNKRLSGLMSFNLTRHSDHHANGHKPFYSLEPHADAPCLPAGYLTTLLLTLIPPLWNRVMDPKLMEWDAVHATPQERALAAKQEQRRPRQRITPILFR